MTTTSRRGPFGLLAGASAIAFGARSVFEAAPAEAVTLTATSIETASMAGGLVEIDDVFAERWDTFRLNPETLILYGKNEEVNDSMRLLAGPLETPDA